MTGSYEAKLTMTNTETQLTVSLFTTKRSNYHRLIGENWCRILRKFGFCSTRVQSQGEYWVMTQWADKHTGKQAST